MDQCHTGRRSWRTLFIMTLGLLCCGCSEPSFTRQYSRITDDTHTWDERVTDPAGIATVRSIAIYPFANQSGEQSLDTIGFSDALARQMNAYGFIRVVTPREVMNEIRKQQKYIETHNRRRQTRLLLGKKAGDGTVPYRNDHTPPTDEDPDVELPPIDPIHNQGDAIRIGRTLQVDVIMLGVITAYDPYYRPKVGLTVHVIATGQNSAAVEAINQLSQWGVPRDANTQRGEVWTRQQMFDANDGSTAREAYMWARRHHTESSAFDTEVYLRNIERYFDFVGGSLAKGFLKARQQAAKEIEEQAKLAAKSHNMTPEAAGMRVQALTRAPIELPDADLVMEKNHSDNIDRSWRPDVYLQDRPDKAKYTAPQVSPDIVTQP